MKIEKLTQETLPEDISLCFDESIFPPAVKVQGGEKRALGNMLLVTSGGRYKLFTEGCDYVRVLEGKGHVKWARGEYPFSEGDILRLDGVRKFQGKFRRKCTVKHLTSYKQSCKIDPLKTLRTAKVRRKDREVKKCTSTRCSFFSTVR